MIQTDSSSNLDYFEHKYVNIWLDKYFIDILEYTKNDLYDDIMNRLTYNNDPCGELSEMGLLFVWPWPCKQKYHKIQLNY